MIESVRRLCLRSVSRRRRRLHSTRTHLQFANLHTPHAKKQVMRVSDNEPVRRSAYDALRSIGPGIAAAFCDVSDI